MSIKFSQIVNETVPVVIECAGETLNLEIRRNFYTPLVSLMIRESANAFNAQIEVMADAIVSWDMLDDDGKVMPVKVEIKTEEDGEEKTVFVPSSVFSELSIALLNIIYRAMLDAVLPNPERASS